MRKLYAIYCLLPLLLAVAVYFTAIDLKHRFAECNGDGYGVCRYPIAYAPFERNATERDTANRAEQVLASMTAPKKFQERYASNH